MASNKTKGKGAKASKAKAGVAEAKTAAPPSSDSPARAHAPESWDKERRALHIFGEMAAGRWNRQALLALAEKLNLSPSTIRDSSAEAARLGPLAVADPEALKALLLGHLEGAIELAALDPMPAMAAKAIVSAVEAAARLTGISAPVKVAATDAKGNDLPPALRSMSGTPELLAFLALHNRMPSEAELAELSGKAAAL